MEKNGDEQQALVKHGPQQALDLQPVVAEQSGDTEQDWTAALRPFNFDSAEAPLCLRVWHRICSYVPALILLLWCLALAYHLYWDPIACIRMCDIHLCWSIIEHGRILAFGGVALKKVLEGSASTNAGNSHASASACENGAADLHHAVFICAYKENIEVLRQTLLSIATQKGYSNGKSYACGHIGVNLCMEAREGLEGETMAKQLFNEFQDHFEWMDVSYHPDKIEGEIQGKCSNLQWAVSQASNTKHIGANTLVTCGDADSMFDSFYFFKVSSKYMELGASSASTIFQPTIMHMLNVFEQSHLVRASSIFTTVVFAGTLEDTISSTLPYSTFTVSSDFMRQFNGWDTDYLNDDWHSGTKAFVAEPLSAQIVHIPFPVVNCAVDAETWCATWIARWKQAKRHALGVEELVYMLQMLPVCHAKLNRMPKHLRDAGGGFTSMYFRFLRVFLFVVSVHIRFAFIIPCGIAMNSIVFGVWVQHHFSMHAHFPLYGEAPDHFIESAPFRWNAALALVLFVIVIGKAIVAVRMVQHLVAVGRIGQGGNMPWWAQSPTFQYIHNLVSMGISLPLLAFAGSLAEIIAIFKVAGWDKRSFQFYVAPKVKGDAEAE